MGLRAQLYQKPACLHGAIMSIDDDIIGMDYPDGSFKCVSCGEVSDQPNERQH